MKHILIIEDDADIQELLQFFLEDNGYRVTCAEDGVDGISKFHQDTYDLILLDIMLPKIDGYAVCELIRKESDVPVMIITALDSEADQIKGLDLKADDYITKPFSMPVLLRKIGAVIRRSGRQEETADKIIYKDIVIDVEEYRVYVADTLTELTKREFEILQMMIENQGRVMTREILLSRLWQYEFYGNERVIDNHIKNLRQKLQRDYIETVKGVGYRIEKVH